ncbi:hypothetical protein V8C34DRAFT_306623 [Trichoderma compactum]
MAQEDAIYDTTAECLEVFSDCIAAMTLTPWLQLQLNRFIFWAAHNGILAWHLRERPEAICTLVDPTPGRATAAVEDASRQNQPPSSHASASTGRSSGASVNLAPETSSVAEAPVDEMRGRVEEALSDLFRFSAAICSAGVSHRLIKAAGFVEWQDDVNLTKRFREGVELLFRHKKPSPSDYMVKRLILTMWLRQRELAYSRRKRVGRSEKEVKDESFKSHSVASLPPRFTAGYSRHGGSGSTTPKLAYTAVGASRGKTAHPNTVQSTVYSATYVPSAGFPQTQPVKTSTTRTQWSTIDDSLTNLPPPPDAGETLEFECPYCGIPFKGAMFQGLS